MHPALTQEWEDLRACYPDAQHIAAPERIRVTLELEPGGYNRSSTLAAVLIPPGYRATAPDGFVVPADLRFAGGEQLPASDAAGLGLPDWLLVSFHLIDANGSSTWRPSGDPCRGDNLTGYLSSVEAFLARGCS